MNVYLKKELVRLPNKYTQFEDLIKNDLKSITLLEHKLWDHKILLLEGKSFIYGLIYALNQWEIEELRKYINKNQRKGFIQLLKSLAKYPIIFISKKDGMLYLYVDY